MAMQLAERARESAPWRHGRWSGDGIAGTKLDEEQAASGLGWFSLALGVALLAAPGGIARAIGAPDTKATRWTMGFVGVREIAAGAAILAEPRPTAGVWSRVVGDLMDLALVGTAAASARSSRSRLAVTFAALAGIAAVDMMCAERLSGRMTPQTRRHRGERGVHVVKVVTVDRPAADLYGYWRNLENLPRIMSYLESVESTGGNRSHWCAKGPLGSRLEWDSEITEDVPDQRISWESQPGASVWNSGTVSFEESTGHRGTVVRVELHYVPPAGAVGAAVAKLFGRAPEQEIQEDLRHFKQLMETGEVLLSDATAKGWGAAQPSETRH
ncbi:MAG: SRPBCC family protein [Gemmatimonas sp.]